MLTVFAEFEETSFISYASLESLQQSGTKPCLVAKILATNFSVFIVIWCFQKYREVSNIRRTKSQNLNASRLILLVVFTQSVEARC